MKVNLTHNIDFIKPLRGDRSYRKLLNDAHNGDIIKIRNGIYATPDLLTANMIDINIVVPDGILCLYSAWHYYEMSTQIPDAFYVAIERKRRVRIPRLLDIKLVYQEKALLDIGRTSTIIDGIQVAIYNRERSLCDAIKYRNKIGIDVMAEILNSYMESPHKNMGLLYQYAKSLRVYNILAKYLEVKI